jgi:TATA-binding protein-associated factor Taf7
LIEVYDILFVESFEKPNRERIEQRRWDESVFLSQLHLKNSEEFVMKMNTSVVGKVLCVEMGVKEVELKDGEAFEDEEESKDEDKE